MTPFVQLLGGGVLLYLGAEWLVGGASALALSLRVPRLLVGLTVVAYGTSAPEVIVGVQAARDAHGDVAVGNVIGSNIANIGLILGLSTLVSPAKADRSLRQREVPVLLLAAAAVPLLLLDGRLSKAESALLLLAALAYTTAMVLGARRDLVATPAVDEVALVGASATTGGAPESGGRVRSAAVAAIGLGVLLLGGDLFVGGAVDLAGRLGISDRVIGLTVVAVGTSLPELVTSVFSSLKGHSDIAVGNVVGSNIFNVLLCLGAAGLAGEVAVPLDRVAADLAVLGGMSLLLAWFVRTERVVSRAEGGVALALYLIYTASVVSAG